MQSRPKAWAALGAAVAGVVASWAALPARAELVPGTAAAVSGTVAPETPGHTGDEVLFTGLLDPPAYTLNDNGLVAFASILGGDARLPDPIPPEHPGDNEAVYVFDRPSGPRLLARRGDEAQGFAEGGVLLGQHLPGGTSFVSTVVLNNQGKAGLRALLADVPDPDGFGQDLIQSGNDAGIYYGSPAEGLTLVAQENSAVPVAGLTHLRYAPVTSSRGGFATGLSTNNDTLVFASRLATTPTAGNPDGAAGEGIFRYSPTGGVDLVAISQSAANPGSSVTLTDTGLTGAVGAIDLDDPRPINAAGSVMFRAALAHNGASVTAANDEALVLAMLPHATRTLAREGQAAAGVASVGTVAYSSFDYPAGPSYTLSRNGATDLYAFKADLAGDGVSTAADSARNATAVFATSPNGTLSLLARENMASPGAPQGFALEFSNAFEDLRVGESGWVAFRNPLRVDGSGAAGSSSRDGLFLGRVSDGGAPELREVAVEQDQTHASMARLGHTGGESGELVDRWSSLGNSAFATNASGQVAFWGALSDASGFGASGEGFYVYDPALDRVAKVIAENDTVVVNGVVRKVESVLIPEDVGGGSGDGLRTFFNDRGELAAWVTLEGGGEAMVLVSARDLLPTGVGTWSTDADGNWSDAAKWAGPRNGAGTEVNFTTPTAADRTVTVDGPQRVGFIFFDNANRYTLAGAGPITLDVNLGNARVGVINGSHTVAAPLVLDDGATVIVEKPTDTLTFAGNMSGAGGLSTGGKGTVILSGTNTYAGPTTVSNGVLQVGSTGNLGNGGAGNGIVLDGGVLRYTAPVSEARSILVTGSRTPASVVQAGIDTGANHVTLTGPMTYQTTAFGNAGYLNKYGAGKLTLSGTGGPGGVGVHGGSVELASNQSWGPAPSRLLPGTSLTVLPGRTLMTAAGGGLVAEGGSTAALSGPTNFGGELLALYTSANRGATVNIDAPASAAALVSGVSAAVPANAADRAAVNVNAPLTLTGAAQSSVYHTLNLGAGGSLTTASNLLVARQAIFNASAPISVGKKATLEGNITFNAGSSLTAGSLQLGVAGGPAIILTRDVTVTGTNAADANADGKVRTAGSSFTLGQGATLRANNILEMSAAASQAATVNGTLDVGGIRLGEATASGNGATLTVNGTATAASKAVPGPSGPAQTGGALVMSAASLGTGAVSPPLRTDVNSGGTLTTTGVTLATRTTSATASATPLGATLTLDVKQGGTLSTGHILVQADERLAGKNQSQNNIHVAGNATAKSIRHESSRNGVAQPEPNAGRLDVRITGKLQMLPAAQGGATSVLRAVPGFGAPAADTGRLDLSDNDLVINYVATDADPLPRLRAVLTSGRNGGTWDGVGIGSLAAKNDSRRITGLAYGTAADVWGLSGAQTASWSGVNVDATSLLVKHTYNGDADLNGKVDINDFFRIDVGYSRRTLHSAANAPGYGEGNFDFDADVDAADYMLIDRAFLGYRAAPPGDANFDGRVDISDFFLTDRGVGDYDGDGDVDAADYAIMDRAFLGGGTPALDGGAGPAPLSAAASAVPEPGTVMSLALGAAGLLSRRRR